MLIKIERHTESKGFAACMAIICYCCMHGHKILWIICKSVTRMTDCLWPIRLNWLSPIAYDCNFCFTTSDSRLYFIKKKNLKIWKKKLLLICPQYAATPWSPLCCYFLAIDEYLKFVRNDKLSNTLIFVRKAYQTCESH